jgi:hypothetical protein
VRRLYSTQATHLNFQFFRIDRMAREKRSAPLTEREKRAERRRQRKLRQSQEESQSSPSSSKSSRKKSRKTQKSSKFKEVVPQKKTCGHFGGINLTTGEPCTRAAGKRTTHPGEGPCYRHGGEAIDGTDFPRKKQEAFLKAFIEHGTLTHAARAMGLSRSLHNKWMASDPTYPERYALAQEAVADKLEKEAMRRAHDGVKEPVYYQGERVGYVRKYSDQLMGLLLRGHRPKRYRDRTEISGPDGGPIETSVRFYIPENNRGDSGNED